MANPGYVRSTDGNDVDNGSTWALANKTMTGAAVDDANGDTIYFSQAHSENEAANTSVTFGTNALPQKLICANDAAEPPTAVATGATIATNGAFSISLSGSFYAYGLTFKPGAGGAVNVNINLAQGGGDLQRYESCVFDVNGSGGSASIQVGQSANQQQPECYWDSCDIKFLNSANDGIAVYGTFMWNGGTALSGTATPSDGLIRVTSLSEGAFVVISGVDLSNFASTLNLVQTGAVQSGRVVFRNCRLPASWSGSLYVAAAVGLRAEMWNCQPALSGEANNYRFRVEDYAGHVREDTAIYRTGGATDGDTPLSWRMQASANAEWPAIILRSPEIFVPNTTTGSSKTLTVEIAQDGTTAALNEEDVWLDVQFLGTTDSPRSSFVNDGPADFFDTGANADPQDDSTEAWSGLSGTNKKQKLSVTLTPREEGVYVCRVFLTKANAVVYVDPKVTVS